MKIPLRLTLTMLTAALGAAHAGSGPNSSVAAPTVKSLATLLGPVFAQANNRTVRILMGGTSIASFGYSNNQIFVSHLKALYGDARADVERMGVINGSWDLPSQGWYKQPYSGPSFVRLRGDSSSLPFNLTGYGSKIIVEYSKETNGGVSQIAIDDVVVGTIDCGGPQALSVKTIFKNQGGLHRITIDPPASGYAYLERVIFEQGNRPGIEVIDGTLGGSGLINVYGVFPRGGQSVPGIPTQPGVGVKSYFERPDIDLVIWSGPVNDQGGNSVDFPTWSARMDEVVEATRPTAVKPGCPLLLIAEMGGHFSMPADPYHAAFLQKYEYLLQLGLNNDHVYTLDWNGATLDPDIVHYAASYYTTGVPVVVDPATGVFTGDFIHPNATAHQVALKLLCQSMNIPVPLESSAEDLENRIRKTSPIAVGISTRCYDGLTLRPALTSGFGAAAFSGQTYLGTVPLVFSEETTNLTDLNQQIATSGTSDRFGKYIEYAQDSGIPIFDGVQIGERVTVSALIKPAVPGQPVQMRSPSNSPGVMYFGGSVLPGGCSTVLYDPNEAPIWLTFDYVRGANSGMLATGRLYSISVTRTHGQSFSMFRRELAISAAPYDFAIGADLHTQPATGVTSSTATVNATARSAGNGVLSVSFDFGTNPNPTGSAFSLNSFVADNGQVVAVSQQFTGLLPNTTYYYRARAMTAGNPLAQKGEILSFHTLAGP